MPPIFGQATAGGSSNRQVLVTLGHKPIWFASWITGDGGPRALVTRAHDTALAVCHNVCIHQYRAAVTIDQRGDRVAIRASLQTRVRGLLLGAGAAAMK